MGQQFRHFLSVLRRVQQRERPLQKLVGINRTDCVQVYLRLPAQRQADAPLVAALLISTLRGAVVFEGNFKVAVVAVHFSGKIVQVGILGQQGFGELLDPITYAFVSVCKHKIAPDILQNVVDLGIIPHFEQMPNRAFPILMRGEITPNFTVQFTFKPWAFAQAVFQEFAEHVMITVHPRAQLFQEQTRTEKLIKDVNAVLAVHQKITGFRVQE